MTPPKPRYSIIIPAETLGRADGYLRQLGSGLARPGARLNSRLHGMNLGQTTTNELIGLLLDTKSPQIFAESAVAGDGSDWNLTELGLLGDISIAMSVTVFDDGNHRSPRPHAEPFQGALVFTPGALLRNGKGNTPADWQEVTKGTDKVSEEGYYDLYRRRLVPVLKHVNEVARTPRSALVTIPGIGCGQFAGPFGGRLGIHFQKVLERLLAEYGECLPNLRAVYFDPYNECSNTRREFHGISLLVRPLTAPGNKSKSQLCPPVAYAEQGDDFSNCNLFSIVAWDHVSWPGNDFFLGARATDDGVKAAATNSMSAVTGVDGYYDAALGKYQPPKPHTNWAAVVQDRSDISGPRLWNPEALWVSPKT